MSQSYLLVIGDAAALAWVLAEQRMAFAERWHKSIAATLEVGDELLVYTTRACFYNPSHDLGRVIGKGEVTTRVHDLRKPIVFGKRRYTTGCDLRIQRVAPLREGVELRPLVPELHAFPDASSWTVWLRRPLVRLDPHDADRLNRELAPLLRPLDSELDAYVRAAKRRRKTSVVETSS